MKPYTVEYLTYGAWELPKKIVVLAQNKVDAWDKATYEEIPKVEGRVPYSAWVSAVTYNNGNYRTFNTFSGNPY